MNELSEKLHQVGFEVPPIPKFDHSKVKGVMARLFEVQESFRTYSTAVEVAPLLFGASEASLLNLFYPSLSVNTQ